MSISGSQVKPVFHEHTHQSLRRLARRLPQAIGLTGREGVGLTTAAQYLAQSAGASLQLVCPEKSDVIDLVSGTITIDIIRRLHTLTRAKSEQTQCIVVVGADTMSPAAQNAFLKLLEEPTASTVFILLIHQPGKLLPTVLSRLQMQQIQAITSEQSGLLLDRLKVTDAARRQQLLFIAGGLPARLTKLSADEALFEAEAALLRQAREFVQGTAYQRLMVCQALKGSRQQAQGMVAYALDIMRYDIATKHLVSPEALKLLDKLELALRRLKANGNPRLVLADVALGLRA